MSKSARVGLSLRSRCITLNFPECGRTTPFGEFHHAVGMRLSQIPGRIQQRIQARASAIFSSCDWTQPGISGRALILGEYFGRSTSDARASDSKPKYRCVSDFVIARSSDSGGEQSQKAACTTAVGPSLLRVRR